MKAFLPYRLFVWPLLILGIFAFLSGTGRAQMILNGNFSANASSFTTFPGYTGSGSNPASITDWTEIGSGSLFGLNGVFNDAGWPVTNEFGPSSLNINTGGSVLEFAFIQHTSGELAQSFNVVAGQSYQLTYDAGVRGATTPDNSGAGIEAVIANGSTGTGTQLLVQTSSLPSNLFYANTTGGYFSGSSYFTATQTGAVLLSFAQIGAGSDVTADVANVNVQAVPEPSAWALLLGGVIFLLVCGYSGWKQADNRSVFDQPKNAKRKRG